MHPHDQFGSIEDLPHMDTLCEEDELFGYQFEAESGKSGVAFSPCISYGKNIEMTLYGITNRL